MIDGDTILYWLSSRKTATFGKAVVDNSLSGLTVHGGGGIYTSLWPLLLQGHVEITKPDYFAMVPPILLWRNEKCGAMLCGARTPALVDAFIKKGGEPRSVSDSMTNFATPLVLRRSGGECREAARSLGIGFTDSPLLPLLAGLPDFGETLAVSTTSAERIHPDVLRNCRRFSAKGATLRWSMSPDLTGRRGLYRSNDASYKGNTYYAILDDFGPGLVLDYFLRDIAVCYFGSAEGVPLSLSYDGDALTITHPYHEEIYPRLPLLLERILFLAAASVEKNGLTTCFRGIPQPIASETARIVGVSSAGLSL
ncbi:MAG: hypothetical protein LUG50_09680 [Planctomycetaceae bacterium]|nr:hypothetical protein [Planctomycetaceae bacterium]